MNEMWSEMSEFQREEYKDYFITYHNGVSKGGLARRPQKPLTALPEKFIRGFEKAIRTKVTCTGWRKRSASLWIQTELRNLSF